MGVHLQKLLCRCLKQQTTQSPLAQEAQAVLVAAAQGHLAQMDQILFLAL